MFGMIPKAIWSRLMPADDSNAIPQNANGLFIEWPDGTRGILETGCGDPAKLSDKEKRIHGIADEWPLAKAFEDQGWTAEDIDVVLLTHLHWDHAGGLTDAEGNPRFPKARHFVHRSEWDDATGGDPLLFRAYPKEIIEPLKSLDWQFVEDQDPFLPGVTAILTGGHTRGHLAYLFEDDALQLDHPAVEIAPRALLFAGDACPTQHHLRMVFHPAYDLYPLQTRAWKREWLNRCAEEEIPVFFSHDPECFGGQLAADPVAEMVIQHVYPISE
jgi:glyoxylase-like metal-dependent hydrolase (beta-lactamase superfamily II)